MGWNYKPPWERDRGRERESLLCNKFIKAKHQILIILINHIDFPQASYTKPWIYSRRKKTMLYHINMLQHTFYLMYFIFEREEIVNNPQKTLGSNYFLPK